LRVEDVAIPRAEIVSVPCDISLPELLETFRSSGLTRLPVYDGTLDVPVGLVHLKDIALRYGFQKDAGGFALRTTLRPFLYAPPSMPIGVLLTKMQTDRTHMALVIDEYGGVDGLVTIEDLIEQVIGEIEDEHDVEEARPFQREGEGAWLALARTPLDEFEAELGRRPVGHRRRGGGRHARRSRVPPDGSGARAGRGRAASLRRGVRGDRRRSAPDQAAAGPRAEIRNRRVTAMRGPAVVLAGVNGWRAAAISAAAGALAGLGQAPFDMWLFMSVGLACLAVLVATAPDPRGGLIRAWAGGAGYFALTLHWIVDPFMVDAARHGWMAPFALVFFAGGLALFWAVAGWAAVRLAKAPVARALAFAPLLTLFEAARGTVFTGFPWAFPGHALIDTPWLAVSAFAGAHGLTLLVAGAGALWASCLLLPRLWPAAVAALAVLFLPFGLPFSHAPAAAPDAPVVRLIQPNAPQHLKWQPDMIPVFWQQRPGPDRGAPDPELGAPDLVVWPETSFPVPAGAIRRRARAAFASRRRRRARPDRRADGWSSSRRATRWRWSRATGRSPRSMTSTTSCRSGNTCRCRGSPTNSGSRRSRRSCRAATVPGSGPTLSGPRTGTWPRLSDDLLRGDLSGIHPPGRP
jgi:CBS domain-containing protein